MLALKKKREAELKAAAEADVATNTTASSTAALVTPQYDNDNTNMTDTTSSSSSSQSAPTAATNKISLLGIGGMKKKDTTTHPNSSTNATNKKRTPGEIRIQKGMSIYK